MELTTLTKSGRRDSAHRRDMTAQAAAALNAPSYGDLPETDSAAASGSATPPTPCTGAAWRPSAAGHRHDRVSDNTRRCCSGPPRHTERRPLHRRSGSDAPHRGLRPGRIRLAATALLVLAAGFGSEARAQTTVISVEPVNTRVEAGEDAQFRVKADPAPSRTLIVLLEEVVRQQRPGQGIVRGRWVNMRRGTTEVITTVGTTERTEQVGLEARPRSDYNVAPSPNHRAVVEVGKGKNVSTVQVRVIEDTITEGETAVFVVAAEPAPEFDLEVTLDVPRASAEDHEDEVDSRFGTGMRVVIPAGRSGIRLEFRTADDDIAEESGFIEVTLDPNGGPGWKIDKPAAVARYASARVDILDNDRTSISVSASSASITEGETVTFTVTSSPLPGTAPFDGDVDVTLDIAGTGAFGVTTGPVSLQIPRGQTQVSHSVATVDDNVALDHGSVTASVSCEPATRCVVKDPARVEIRDNEPEIRAWPNLPGEPISRSEDNRRSAEGSQVGFWLQKSARTGSTTQVYYKLEITGGFSAYHGLATNTLPRDGQIDIIDFADGRPGGADSINLQVVDDEHYQGAPGRIRLTLLPDNAGQPVAYHVSSSQDTASWIIDNDDPAELPVHTWNFRLNMNLPLNPPLCWSPYPGAAKYNVLIEARDTGSQVENVDITRRCRTIDGGQRIVVTALDAEGMSVTYPSDPVCTNSEGTGLASCTAPEPWLSPSFRVVSAADSPTVYPQIQWDPYPGATGYEVHFRRPAAGSHQFDSTAANMVNVVDEYTARARAKLGGSRVTAWTKWFHTCRPPTTTRGGDMTTLSRDPHPGCYDANRPTIIMSLSDTSIVEGGEVILKLIADNQEVVNGLKLRFAENGSFGAKAGALFGPGLTTIGNGYETVSLSIGSGSGGREFKITTEDDTTAEDDGSVTATLLPGSNYNLPQNPTLTVEIRDDDSGAAGNSGAQGWANPNFRVTDTTDPPHIEWDPYPNASGYTVEFTRPVNWSGRKDDGYAEMSNTSPEYTMRTKAHLSNGAESEWTDWFNTCRPPNVHTGGPSDPPNCTSAQPAQSWDPNFSVNAGANPPQIEWAPFSGATGYTVEFSDPINWSGRKDGGYAEMYNDGPYYRMRAKAHTAGADTPWSDWFRTCKPPHTATADPPASDADCSPGTAGWDPSFSVDETTNPPQIEWVAHPSGATGYTAQFNLPIDWTGAKNNGFAEMSHPGPQYRMRVKAHLADGAEEWTGWFLTCRPPFAFTGTDAQGAPVCVDASGVAVQNVPPVSAIPAVGTLLLAGLLGLIGARRGRRRSCCG